jgi:hypothetical protein
VPLDELVGAPASGDPRVYARPVTRNGMTVIPLTRNPGGLQAFKQILPAGPAGPNDLEPLSGEPRALVGRLGWRQWRVMT